jgi:hypothetical protein
MANRPVSSSERKGVLIVAGIALVVTLCGLGVAWCGRPSKAISPHDVEVLVDGDTAGAIPRDSIDASSGFAGKTLRQKERNDSSGSGKRDKKVREGKKSKKPDKKKKTYSRRSPLDEPV